MSRGSGRQHARIQLAIWDGDFAALTADEQLVYLMLVSSSDMSYAGVLPLLPKRLAAQTSDLNERRVRAALKGLAAQRYVILDEDTDEICVRTYVRHDGILKQPNVIRALNKAYAKVHSERIREAIRVEMVKAIGEGFPEGIPQGHANALLEGFAKGVLEGVA